MATARAVLSPPAAEAASSSLLLDKKPIFKRFDHVSSFVFGTCHTRMESPAVLSKGAVANKRWLGPGLRKWGNLSVLTSSLTKAHSASCMDVSSSRGMASIVRKPGKGWDVAAHGRADQPCCCSYGVGDSSICTSISPGVRSRRGGGGRGAGWLSIPLQRGAAHAVGSSVQSVDQEEKEDREEEGEEEWEGEEEEEGKEGEQETEVFGEVDCILTSRVVDNGTKTEYLVKWMDDHPDSWEPAENVAIDISREFEIPWLESARKADEVQLTALLDQGRDINAIDENQRTALHFAAGLGSEKVVRFLGGAGASVHVQDRDGYTPLHIAAGYVHLTCVRALLELGANPEAADNQGRTVLDLARQLLERTPQANPMHFARRIALDQVVKALEEAVFEDVQVEQILDTRVVGDGVIEYLVRWSDDSEDSWVPAEDVGEDLIKDFQSGLEYAVAEKVLDKREIDGRLEYLVKWADHDEKTWEPAENLSAEVIAEFADKPAET